MLRVADGKRPQGVETAYRHPELWTPGADAGGYTELELNAGPSLCEGSIALSNDEVTDVDPILHGVGLAFDDMYRELGKQTQLELIAAKSREFAAAHPTRAFGAAGVKSYLMMALMDRVRGVDTESPDFILNRGVMYDGQLGRREMDDGSYVGSAFSRGPRLRLDGTDGDAYSRGGVGLVAGPEKTE